MEVVKTETIADANLVSSNVPVTETLWTAGTYVTGTQRYEGHLLYEVIATPSTTDQPSVGVAASPPTWKSVGAINRWRMFDQKANYQTVVATPLIAEITVPVAATAASVLNVDGKELQITVTDSVEGIVYDRTVQLLDNSGVIDWWTYYFLPYTQKTDVILTDLPSYPGATIKLQVRVGTGNVKVGEFTVGNLRYLGETNFGSSAGILDFSKKTVDDQGNYLIEQRSFSKRGRFDVQIDTTSIDYIHSLLTSLRSSPAVWVGSGNFSSTIIFGFYRDFDINIQNPVASQLTISIEGL